APARVLDLVLIGDVRLAFDDRLLSEYRDVQARPRLGFAADDVRDLLEYLAATGEPVLARPLAVELPDPTDLPFLEVAAQANAPLVTGNTAHCESAGHFGVPVLTPRAFVESWRSA
ncbi:MAG: PIN domain-containing protein, partial [Chloroflexi bacterium]|nr:PIN domain-containing protein [Chloroflexota bacterium]